MRCQRHLRSTLAVPNVKPLVQTGPMTVVGDVLAGAEPPTTPQHRGLPGLPTRRTRVKVWCALAALITGTTMVAPAVTATAATVAPETFLVLGVERHGDGQFVTLHCDPPSGTHSHPDAACAALSAAGGDINKVPGQPDARCPDTDDPATAIASGNYQGQQVIFRRTYSNRCDLASKTAPVFEF